MAFDPLASQNIPQYMSQYNSAMTPGGSQAGSSNFYNSPGYNIGFGTGAAASWMTNPITGFLQQPNVSMPEFFNSDAYKLQYGNNQAANPAERFQNDPGIQAAIKAALPTVVNNYAGQGLGASTNAAHGIADYMFNHYNDYMNQQQQLYQGQLQNKFGQQQLGINTYQNQQDRVNSLFNNYQNQLAGLANQGYNSSNTLAGYGQQSGQNLSSLFGNLYNNTGQGISQNAMGAGNNIAELYANLGSLLASGYLNTGAAMSNNMMQGSILGSQLANAQNQSNSQTLNSLLQGQGAMNAANYVYGASGWAQPGLRR